MQTQHHQHDRSYLPYVIGSILTGIVLSVYFNLSPTIIIILTVVGMIVVSSMLLWANANSHASGDEWWQDDNCSGWRGY